MPLSKIDLRPGVTVELTPTANEGGYSDSQLIRFFAGRLQKYGGWASVPTIDRLAGVCRGMVGWADLMGAPHVAMGTEQRLSVLTGGVLSDITPVVFQTDAAPALATVALSSTITITDATYSPNVGDWINLVTWVGQGNIVLAGFYLVTAVTSGTTYTITSATPAVSTRASGGLVPVYTTTLGSAVVSVHLTLHGLSVGSVFDVTISTVVGGLTLFGTYVVNVVTDTSHFQIAAAGLAAAGATVAENGANMRIQYLLPSGFAVTMALGGWGVDDYGSGDWGTTAAGTAGALLSPARTWSLDHFGQDLIASPDHGKIYYWAPPTAAPAVVLDASAPIYNRAVFSIAQVQIIMACGSEAGGSYFPTLVRWCDSGDFTAWVATATNQAGSYQIPSGSSITAALAVGLGALIWTDVDLWTVTYQGLPFVFGFNQIGVNCEAMSKKAPAVVGQSVIWPSNRGFFRYSGGSVTPLPCAVWDYLFTNLDPLQTDQVCAGVNTLFNEVAWFFPVTADAAAAAGVAETIWYVKLNYLDNVWDLGVLTRTAWIDHSAYGNPMATDDTGAVFVHESGNDADGSAMVSYATTGYYDLQDGEAETYVNLIIPDFVSNAGSALQISVKVTDEPGEAAKTLGPYVVTPTTRRIRTSLRGRQVAFEIASSDLGSRWRMGAVRYNPSPAGTRP